MNDAPSFTKGADQIVLEDAGAQLFDQFRTELSHQLGVPVCTVTPEARAALTRHDWPGNVGELKSVAERVILTHGGRVVTEADLALETRQLRHH